MLLPFFSYNFCFVFAFCEGMLGGVTVGYLPLYLLSASGRSGELEREDSRAWYGSYYALCPGNNHIVCSSAIMLK